MDGTVSNGLLFQDRPLCWVILARHSANERPDKRKLCPKSLTQLTLSLNSTTLQRRIVTNPSKNALYHHLLRCNVWRMIAVAHNDLFEGKFDFAIRKWKELIGADFFAF